MTDQPQRLMRILKRTRPTIGILTLGGKRLKGARHPDRVEHAGRARKGERRPGQRHYGNYSDSI